MRKFNTLAVIAIAVGLAALPAWAIATSDWSTDHAEKTPSDFDARAVPAAAFLTKSAAANRFEIVTGRLAQQRAQSPTIKELGAMFAQDHAAALQQGAQVAASLGITVPEGLEPRQ